MSRHAALTLLTGGLTGLFSGFTGVGGGAILVSMMVSFLGMTQHRAQGTSLAVIISLAFFGAITYSLQGYHELSLSLTLAFGSIFGVVAGARIMSGLPAAQLRRAFGIFLFFISLQMLARGVVQVSGPPVDPSLVGLPLWLALGVVSGMLAGFLGIGGAMIIIPVMVLVAGYEQHMAQGVSLAVITITSLVGAYTHYKLGNVDVGAAVLMAPSSVVMVVVASALAGQLDSFWLTKIFGLAMLWFGYQFTFRKGRQPAAAPPPAQVAPQPGQTG